MTLNLWTIRQVADHCSVKPVTIRVYRSRQQMPDAHETIDNKPLWNADDIVAWRSQSKGN